MLQLLDFQLILLKFVDFLHVLFQLALLLLQALNLQRNRHKTLNESRPIADMIVTSSKHLQRDDIHVSLCFSQRHLQLRCFIGTVLLSLLRTHLKVNGKFQTFHTFQRTLLFKLEVRVHVHCTYLNLSLLVLNIQLRLLQLLSHDRFVFSLKPLPLFSLHDNNNTS